MKFFSMLFLSATSGTTYGTLPEKEVSPSILLPFVAPNM